MATLLEFFKTDHPQYISRGGGMPVRQSGSEETVDGIVQVVLIFDALVSFAKVYVPESARAEAVEAALVRDGIDAILSRWDSILILQSLPGEQRQDSRSLNFSKSVIIYTDNVVGDAGNRAATKVAHEKGWRVHYRTRSYAVERSKVMSPLAFISHDSRDKQSIAAPLAEELSKVLCPVWYDEYSLKVGDSLRKSIDRGIETCPFCIFILSKAFLSNPGWPVREFNAVFHKELAEGRNVMLPIWVDVTKEEVRQYSPELADRVALPWSKGIEYVSRTLRHTLQAYDPSKGQTQKGA